MEPRIDYRAVFSRSSGPTAVLSPDLVYLDVNEDYLEAAGRPAEDLIGRNVLERFPRNPQDPDETGPEDLQASLERVLATGERDVVPLTKYDVEDPGRPGVFEERYWAIVNTPVVVGGRVSLIIHCAQEMTHAIHHGETVTS